MSSFVLTQLRNVANIISGFAFKSEQFSESGIPVIKIANIKNGEIIFGQTEKEFLPVEYLNLTDKKFRVKKGDVLISLTGSHISQPNSVVGRVAQYRKTFISLLNQRAGKLVLNPNAEVNLTFFYYILSTTTARQAISMLAHGAANQANVSPKDIEKLKFNLPCKTDQKKIAAILSAYDDLIENNKRRIALLEKMAEEIYREWFVRFRFPGHEKVRFVKGVPEGWGTVTLGKIVDLIMGQSPNSKFYNQTGDGLPFNQGVGTYGYRFPQKLTFCSTKGRKANKGDILFSVRAPVGRLNIADCDMIIGRGLAAIRHKNGLNSYLYYLLKVAFSNEDIIGNGAIFNSVGKSELENFKIFEPERNIVIKFNEITEKIDQDVYLLSNSLEILTKTRDMLLPRLISGKLSVENLDIQFPPSMQTQEET